ncbi:MAG: hypothetical protein HY868_09295 [Chloroflexi bacterium]|nr:hypothetical protein [Chloroflexota bacterium]
MTRKQSAKKSKSSRASLGKAHARLAKPRQRTARGKRRKSNALVPTPPERTPRRVMVIVHGGGDIPENYHEGLVNGVQAQHSKPFDFISAYYSDVITNRERSIAPRVESPAEAKFKADFEKQLRETHARTQSDNQARGIVTTSFLGIDNAITDTIKEVVVYLFDQSAASQIQDRVVAALDQAAQDFDEIVLVTHSLGTVVAFDALKQFAHRYKIAFWFTLGCPLGKLIMTRLRASDLGEIARAHVSCWYNVYDTNDIVAGVIGSFLPAPDLHIHDIFVEVAPAMPSAHDYFANPATHAILAEALK